VLRASYPNVILGDVLATSILGPRAWLAGNGLLPADAHSLRFNSLGTSTYETHPIYSIAPAIIAACGSGILLLVGLLDPSERSVVALAEV